MTYKRVDENQTRIVAKFRNLGCVVWITSECGKGAPDLIVGIPSLGWMKMIEVKDGSKPPSHRRLTPDEKAFHEKWNGLIKIICSEEEAENLVKDAINDCKSMLF